MGSALLIACVLAAAVGARSATTQAQAQAASGNPDRLLLQAPCGDGWCDPVVENQCNCATDCGAPQPGQCGGSSGGDDGGGGSSPCGPANPCCDNDGVCEPDIGEWNGNCGGDCPDATAEPSIAPGSNNPSPAQNPPPTTEATGEAAIPLSGGEPPPDGTTEVAIPLSGNEQPGDQAPSGPRTQPEIPPGRPQFTPIDIPPWFIGVAFVGLVAVGGVLLFIVSKQPILRTLTTAQALFHEHDRLGPSPGDDPSQAPLGEASIDSDLPDDTLAT